MVRVGIVVGGISSNRRRSCIILSQFIAEIGDLVTMVGYVVRTIGWIAVGVTDGTGSLDG